MYYCTGQLAGQVEVYGGAMQDRYYALYMYEQEKKMGRGEKNTLRKASMSPIAGINSGIKGLSFVSSCIVCALYRVMC